VRTGPLALNGHRKRKCDHFHPQSREMIGGHLPRN
jgi:hypothetical protein